MPAASCASEGSMCASSRQARFRLGVFRWPEDAAAWKGRTADASEHDEVERCQAALRNDSETQPFFLFFGAAWVVLGAPTPVVSAAFVLYVVARALHTTWLVRPRQPLRNRASVVGRLVLLGIVVDAVRRAVAACA